MAPRALLLLDASFPERDVADAREVAGSLADCLDAPLSIALSDARTLDRVHATLAEAHSRFLPPVEPTPLLEAPMSSAEFLWRPDGRPDWGAMWTSFCELALYGGPPHRGPEQALWVTDQPMTASESAAVAEIQRGIWETTGLEAVPDEPGWLAICCDSRRMAAWLCATIVLENVDARCSGGRLYVPASGDYLLKDQVKSVITVVAKTHHYWQSHAQGLYAPRRR